MLNRSVFKRVHLLHEFVCRARVSLALLLEPRRQRSRAHERPDLGACSPRQVRAGQEEQFVTSARPLTLDLALLHAVSIRKGLGLFVF